MINRRDIYEQSICPIEKNKHDYNAKKNGSSMKNKSNMAFVVSWH